MDFQAIQTRVMETGERYYRALQAYFMDLNQKELYGWGVVGLGVILLLVGFIVWL